MHQINLQKEKMKHLIISAIVFLTFSTQAQDQVNNKYGKGVFNTVAKDSSFAIKMNMRFQNLFIADTDLDGDLSDNDIATQFLVRRARLKFGGFAYSPKLTYKVELGLSSKDVGSPTPYTKDASRIILDAVLKYNFYKNVSVWVGQTKLPGNRERVISSQKLQFVDRSLVNSKYNLDRDMGLQLRNHHKIGGMVVREAFSISQGEGRNIASDNMGGLDYTSRVEFLPMGKFTSKGDYFGSDLKREEKPKLALGVTFDHHNHAARQNGNSKSYLSETRTLNTVFVDMMFKYKGLSIMAEYADKKSEGSPVIYEDFGFGSVAMESFNTGSGINAQIGYLLKSNWEFAGRYTVITPQDVTGRDDVSMYTFGVSRYVAGHYLKIQSDVSLTQENGSDDNLMYRLQVELAF